MIIERKKIKQNLSDRLFMVFVYGFLIFFSTLVILPMFQVITISLSPAEIVNKFGFHLIPTKITLEGYHMIFLDDTIWTAYKNTIIRVVLGVSLTVCLTFLAAYPISKRGLPHRKLITLFMFLTMFFSGGLVPAYVLINKLGLRNSVLALILPGAISTFMVLVTRNFIGTLPESLEEAAKMEGANELQILVKIIIPLSLPILATVALFSAVSHWNAWFDCMLYVPDPKRHVIQLLLQRLLKEGSDVNQEVLFMPITSYISPESRKMATVVVTFLPIIIIYPFLQKYFVKGVLIGSVKG